MARTDRDGKWRYVGVLALSDLPREDSALTIKAAREMGVDVKMVTSDHSVIDHQGEDDISGNNKLIPDSGNKSEVMGSFRTRAFLNHGRRHSDRGQAY